MVLDQQNLLDSHRFYFIFAVSLIASLIAVGFVIEYFMIDAEGASNLCLKTCKKRNAEAAKKSETYAGLYDNIYISIRTSKACEISGTCPSYKFLADIYDNSNKYLSGDFFFNNDTGRWDREPPVIYNSFELYKVTIRPTPVVIWVNPDDYVWDHSRQIMIESEYYRPIAGRAMEENVIYAFEGREIKQCHTAIIGWTTLNGTALLTDTLNHFMSDCEEPLEFIDEKEIFMNSTIFPDCDKDCFHLKYLFGKELKAFHQVEKEYEEKYAEDPDERPETIKEKYEESLSKEERRIERLTELEDIQECKKYILHQKNQGVIVRGVDCNDEDDRIEFLEEMRTEYPDGVRSVEKYRNGYTNKTK